MSQGMLRHVLYVEDDPDIREMVAFVLRDIGGFEVTVCANGEEALRCAPASNAQLALLDVMMPGLDGPATMEALHRLPQMHDMPVIFMTAKICVPEVEGYMALGALGVIAKPFDTMALCDSIRTLWDQRHRRHATG